MERNEYVLCGNRTAGDLLIQMVDDHDLSLLELQAAALREMTGSEDWCIAAAPVAAWNRDLAPWEAPAVFGKDRFGSGAAETLARLVDRVLPALRRDCPEARRIYLCGYSLAGLFSLWAASQTDLFSGVAAVSPSVWFPGWLDFAVKNPIRAGAVYLSLGDKEEKAKNPVLAGVGDVIRAQYRMLMAQNVPCRLEWNPGNHFADFDLRMAKGMAWLLER